MQSPEEWARNCQVNTGPDVDANNRTEGNNTTLGPKVTVGKSTQRRSRASKNFPTTLLNANARDFRAVVQKYTGYHSASFGARKGPINLNFSRYKYYSSISEGEWPGEAHHQQELQERREAEDRNLLSFGANNISITTSDIDPDCELFVPSESYSHRPDEYPTSFDDLDIDNFSR